jgi:hypothetical protein
MPRLKFQAVRDVVLLLAGLALLGHETLVVAEPRYLLIGIAAAMIGLPATFLADRRFVTSTPSQPPAEPPPLPPAEQDPAA